MQHLVNSFNFYVIGSLKFSSEGHDLVEPPIIVTPTSSTASPTQPKYLELIYDENDDPISLISSSNGYEIPIPDTGGLHTFIQNNCNDRNSCISCGGGCADSGGSNTNSLSSNHRLPNLHQLQHNKMLHHAQLPSSDCLDLNSVEKERTFSSSSTVSESSICPTPHGQLSAATILKVTLPNSKEDCSSNEALLSHHQTHNLHTNSSDKLRPFYTNAKVEDVLNCDGKTMM